MNKYEIAVSGIIVFLLAFAAGRVWGQHEVFTACATTGTAHLVGGGTIECKIHTKGDRK